MIHVSTLASQELGLLLSENVGHSFLNARYSGKSRFSLGVLGVVSKKCKKRLNRMLEENFIHV